jgi:hypothetical protein
VRNQSIESLALPPSPRILPRAVANASNFSSSEILDTAPNCRSHVERDSIRQVHLVVAGAAAPEFDEEDGQAHDHCPEDDARGATRNALTIDDVLS